MTIRAPGLTLTIILFALSATAEEPARRFPAALDLIAQANIRTAADTASIPITQIGKGTRVIALGEAGDFYVIQLPGGTGQGYLSRDAAKFAEGPALSLPSPLVSLDAPTTPSEQEKSLPLEERVQALERQLSELRERVDNMNAAGVRRGWD